MFIWLFYIITVLYIFEIIKKIYITTFTIENIRSGTQFPIFNIESMVKKKKALMYEFSRYYAFSRNVTNPQIEVYLSTCKLHMQVDSYVAMSAF
jgi:hypothetical protein